MTTRLRVVVIVVTAMVVLSLSSAGSALPLLLNGGTEEAFRAGQTGSASLTSTLECGATGQVVATWQVVVLVVS